MSNRLHNDSAVRLVQARPDGIDTRTISGASHEILYGDKAERPIFRGVPLVFEPEMHRECADLKCPLRDEPGRPERCVCGQDRPLFEHDDLETTWAKQQHEELVVHVDAFCCVEFPCEGNPWHSCRDCVYFGVSICPWYEHDCEKGHFMSYKVPLQFQPHGILTTEKR